MTPISSNVKDKNSIFTARDEDMIFCYFINIYTVTMKVENYARVLQWQETAASSQVTLPVSALSTVDSENLLKKAVEKHHRLKNKMISATLPSSYRLLSPDKSKVKILPGSDEEIVLKRYRERIDKAYERITFYLSSIDDYLDNIRVGKQRPRRR